MVTRKISVTWCTLVTLPDKWRQKQDENFPQKDGQKSTTGPAGHSALSKLQHRESSPCLPLYSPSVNRSAGEDFPGWNTISLSPTCTSTSSVPTSEKKEVSLKHDIRSLTHSLARSGKTIWDTALNGTTWVLHWRRLQGLLSGWCVRNPRCFFTSRFALFWAIIGEPAPGDVICDQWQNISSTHIPQQNSGIFHRFCTHWSPHLCGC